ncbi:hypothetical protein F2P81_021496 [Scophthalmus maximus]|uniref:Uncharacterized protein n=1 Tax=Scophthalmus maximus TaxID=52904 RepID=A0A6A4S2J5_SCOMX|nr:hypothetical protein F2P81_021496 [Scophthalmus maximus]
MSGRAGAGSDGGASPPPNAAQRGETKTMVGEEAGGFPTMQQCIRRRASLTSASRDEQRTFMTRSPEGTAECKCTEQEEHDL